MVADDNSGLNRKRRQVQALETAHQFGHEDGLVGIIHHAAAAANTASAADVDRPQLPGVVLLNSGIDYRVGPKRLYVGIARWLASAGLSTIRFDYGGLGDSRKAVYSADDQAVGAAGVDDALVEAKLAMELLRQQTGVERFVVVGLCSGADDAHRLALLDPSICGVVLIDGYGYRNWRYWLEHYTARIFSARRWKNFFERIFPALFGGSKVGEFDADAAAREAIWFYAMPDRAQMAKQLQTLLDRGTQLFYVYSGETHEYYNHENQFQQVFSEVDFDGQLAEHFIPQADHTFTRTVDRVELMKRLETWIDQAFRRDSSRR